MRCPVYEDVQLVVSDRQGIEIDCCPQCRGIWLGRGELDKIIGRSASEQGPAVASPSGVGVPHHAKPYRKKSIWHELFD